MGKYEYLPKARDLHIIYGYLEVGEVIDLTIDPPPKWAYKHPHWRLREQMHPRNALFIAAKFSSIWPGKAGAGIFPFSPSLILTSQNDHNRKRSLWSLPSCFFDANHACQLSYHRHKQGSLVEGQERLLISSAYRGQEFVTEQSQEVRSWVVSLGESCFSS